MSKPLNPDNIPEKSKLDEAVLLIQGEIDDLYKRLNLNIIVAVAIPDPVDPERGEIKVTSSSLIGKSYSLNIRCLDAIINVATRRILQLRGERDYLLELQRKSSERN